MAKAATAIQTKARVSTPKVPRTRAPKSPISFAYDGATITSNIARIKANDEAQEKLVHQTCLMCVVQVLEHRNTDFATRLLNALGKGWRTTSLVKWAEHHMPIKLKTVRATDTGATTRSFKVLPEDDATWKRIKARFDRDPSKFVSELPTFWDYDPEVTDFKGVDFLKLIESAVKRAEKANVYPKGHAKEGQPLSAEDAKKNNLIGLAQARTLLSTLKGSVHPGTSATQ